MVRLERGAPGVPLGGIGVLALATETAVSLRGLDYAGVTPPLQALMFGAEDLAAELGIAARDENGKHTAIVVAARSALLIAAVEARAGHRHAVARPARPRGAAEGVCCDATQQLCWQAVHPS